MIYNTNVSIGQTPEQRKVLMRGLGFYGSQLTSYENDNMSPTQPTTSDAPRPAQGVMAKRPGSWPKQNAY